MKKTVLFLILMLMLSANAFGYWLMVRAYYWPDVNTSEELHANIYIDGVYTGHKTPYQFEDYVAGTYTVQLAGYTGWVPASANVVWQPANGAIVFGTFLEPNVPVVLSGFSAVTVQNNLVQLNWTTQSEVNMQGFHVLRNTLEDLATANDVSGLIPATNTSQSHSYSFTDTDLYAEGTYYYWLQCLDYDGSFVFNGPVSMQYVFPGTETPEVPTVTELKSVYPNPFNPTAFIPYSVADASNVDLAVYNSRGQLVRRFPSEARQPGSYTVIWDGRNDLGGDVATGVYYVIMKAGKDTFQRRAVLMK